MRGKLCAVLLALVFVLCVFAPVSQADAAEPYTESSDFLIDWGNGDTDWVTSSGHGSYGKVVASTLAAEGHECAVEGNAVAVDGVSGRTIGAASTGGSLSEPGTTGATETATWHVFKWNGNSSVWKEVADLSESYTGGGLAVAFYPDGILPAETPDYRSSWTMATADAENSMNQTIMESDALGSISWEAYPDTGTEAYGSYGGSLYVQGHVITKSGNMDRETRLAALNCYSAEDGTKEWEFDFKSHQMEISSGLVVGQYVYVQTTMGYIYKLSWADGPGENNSNVTSFGGKPASSLKASDEIPEVTVDFGDDNLSSYGEGLASMVFDSGAIYAKSHNGMLYCFDTDLNLLWSYQMGGQNYYTTPAVHDGKVFAGAYNGHLYVVDADDGSLITETEVYQGKNSKGHLIGAANAPIVIDSEGTEYVFVTYSDGLGMNSTVSGLKIYTFDGSALTEVKDLANSELGVFSSYISKYVTDSFTGVLAATGKALYTIDCAGNYTDLGNVMTGSNVTHNAGTVVNDKYVYFSTYGSGNRAILELGTDGRAIGSISFDNKYFSMANAVVVDGYVIRADDNGITVISGTTLPEYYDPAAEPDKTPLIIYLAIVLAIIVVLLVAVYAVLKVAKKWEHPFAEIHHRVMTYFFGENYSHNTKSKRKLRLVICVGLIATFLISLLALCLGSETTFGPVDAISTAVSAIQKGGHGLTYEEMLIYNQRLPRVMAALGVGIGLSVAGAVYQAVIKNPLVEPYIMGVSSGAGTFAVAVITFDFTFIGLFASQSIYLTAVSAIVGGLLAFGCTMFLAEKTGGKSINYVLAGIVVGLVFSAVQSIMMIESGNKAASALSWLYGSFASITWDKVWLVLIPAIALSLVPLVWAKELNLVLLGEDQAMQMGLDAKRFDRIMLIIASVLTAFCVAFCGIIGFVGLVIPHLSRMLLGGDHRMMLPTAMAFGGFLMVAADLLARILLTGYELPVGAITTVIGVPVFAYLLIKRGRGYDS